MPITWITTLLTKVQPLNEPVHYSWLSYLCTDSCRFLLILWHCFKCSCGVVKCVLVKLIKMPFFFLIYFLLHCCSVSSIMVNKDDYKSVEAVRWTGLQDAPCPTLPWVACLRGGQLLKRRCRTVAVANWVCCRRRDAKWRGGRRGETVVLATEAAAAAAVDNDITTSFVVGDRASKRASRDTLTDIGLCWRPVRARAAYSVTPLLASQSTRGSSFCPQRPRRCINTRLTFISDLARSSSAFRDAVLTSLCQQPQVRASHRRRRARRRTYICLSDSPTAPDFVFRWRKIIHGGDNAQGRARSGRAMMTSSGRRASAWPGRAKCHQFLASR